MAKTNTSWENVSGWYDDLVCKSGHYYHEHVIYPNLRRLLKSKKPNQSLLDIGCGQGSFAHQLSPNYSYFGVDLSKSLIQAATKRARSSEDKHKVTDVCNPFSLDKKDFSHAAMILSFQNIENPAIALQNIKNHLKQGGTLVLVLNHPCFRIPRQSSWGIDEQKKLQYRRIDTYMSELSIPIEMHPGEKSSTKTFSFHRSLSDISGLLSAAGFYISSIEEWISDKISEGKMAKMENRCREEFPLFMAIIAKSL